MKNNPFDSEPTYDGFETGWEQAAPGVHAEVKYGDDWYLGMVVSTPRENERAIELYTYDPLPGGNPDFLQGHGLSVPIYGRTEKTIRNTLRFPELD
jgi:hypothetical protein